MGDAELALHIEQCFPQCRCPTQDVVNDDVSVEILVDGETTGPGKVLPRRIHVVDECDESGRAVDWAKRHDVVRPLGGIWTSKCECCLQGWCNRNLVITRRSVEQPKKPRQSKGHIYSGVTSWDGVCDWMCDLIQRDIINTKAPYEIKDVADVFLMRFGSQEGFE